MQTRHLTQVAMLALTPSTCAKGNIRASERCCNGPSARIDW
jgi:hypothetical protein